jgi:hypothetical protein
MKKLVIGGTVAILFVYLSFVIVNQIYPYVNWLLQREDVVQLEFADTEAFLASEQVAEPVKAWLRLPSSLAAGVALAGIEYRDDRLTTPQVTVRYVREGRRHMDYSIGGNYKLPKHEKLKTVDLDGMEADMLVGRDNTVVIKWRDPSGPPYRYLYFYDPALTEPEMVAIAAAAVTAESSPSASTT